MLRTLCALALAVCLCFSCSKTTNSYKPLSRGILLDNMDTTADPRKDFYRFVNGNWQDRTEIPSYAGRWGAIDELRQYNRNTLRRILDDAISQSSYSAGTDEAKALDFYRIGTDSLLAEKSGIEPIQPLLRICESVSDLSSLNNALADLDDAGVGSLFSSYIWVDDKRSGYNAAFLGQGGTSLPSRDFYLIDNDRFKAIREALKDYIRASFRLLGDSAQAEMAATKILEMETAFARISMSPLELRDQEKTYNKMPLTEADELSKNIDFRLFFNTVGMSDLDTVIVNQVEFLRNLDMVINAFDFRDWQLFLKWQVASSLASFLNHEFVNASFNFTKTLQGTQRMLPRSDRVLQNANSFTTVGEGIARIYIKHLFPEESKASAQEMVNDIIAAMGDHIKNLDWMSLETKAKALEKLSTMKTKICYPDEWRGLANLNLTNRSYAENVLEVRSHWNKYFKENLRKPINRKYWTMMPQEVNAHYNPNNNEIVFPAGFLQPPFFDADMDAAVNYGAIGMVIGHEITHGFDDTGSQFDSKGNLSNWWSDEDKKKFKELTDKLVEQYNGYTQVDTLRVNGRLTLGENIADLGGLAIAFDGLKRYWDRHGKPGVKEGYTPEQRYFIAWNQGLRSKFRPEELRRLVMTAPHAPPHIRAVGPVVNNRDFFKAFNVNEGDPMRRPDSLLIKIW